MLEEKPQEKKTPQAQPEKKDKKENPAFSMMDKPQKQKPDEPIKKKSKIRFVGYVIIGIILILIVVQFLSASYYKMTVNVVEGENIVGVNPTAEKLDFGDLSRGNGMTRYVTLKSSGSIPSYIMVWKFGNAAELIKVEKNNFVLEREQEVQIPFTINVPPSAEAKRYNGQVVVFKLPKIF